MLAVSKFSGLVGVVAVDSVDVAGGGGGSIDGAGDGLERGSGSSGIGSSADDVSIVKCLVTGGDSLKV